MTNKPNRSTYRRDQQPEKRVRVAGVSSVDTNRALISSRAYQSMCFDNRINSWFMSSPFSRRTLNRSSWGIWGCFLFHFSLEVCKVIRLVSPKICKFSTNDSAIVPYRSIHYCFIQGGLCILRDGIHPEVGIVRHKTGPRTGRNLTHQAVQGWCSGVTQHAANPLSAFEHAPLPALVLHRGQAVGSCLAGSSLGACGTACPWRRVGGWFPDFAHFNHLPPSEALISPSSFEKPFVVPS